MKRWIVMKAIQQGSPQKTVLLGGLVLKRLKILSRIEEYQIFPAYKANDDSLKGSATRKL